MVGLLGFGFSNKLINLLVDISGTTKRLFHMCMDEMDELAWWIFIMIILIISSLLCEVLIFFLKKIFWILQCNKLVY